MNGERLEALIVRLRGSLWFVPSVMTCAAVVLAILTVWLDENLSAEMPEVWFLFSASAEGSRQILSTIAGSIITVTGVVFSITIVALQLASSEYTPRVLRTFTDSRPTQLVMGTFIATFTYALLVLRAVRSEVDDVDRFIPGISLTLAVLMALVSIGALIFFVNHIAHSIRVETVVDRIAAEVLDRIDELFPEEMGDPETPAVPLRPDSESGEESLIHAGAGGYLQHVDEEALLKIAVGNDLLIRMSVPVGTFLIDSDVVAVAVGRPWLDEQTRKKLRAAFHVGPERTLYQDVTRGFVELTDIALRALSPSLNDPTTAIECIDHLSRLLRRLAGRRFPSRYRAGEDGRVRFIAARPEFDEIARLPLSQIRHAGGGYPAVAERLIHAIERIAGNATADRIRPLLIELEALREEIRISVANPLDLERLSLQATEAVEKLRRMEMREGVLG